MNLSNYLKWRKLRKKLSTTNDNILLMGCGNSRELLAGPIEARGFPVNIIGLDIDPNCNPDIIHDLNYPLSFIPDETFDELHAYEVLEHIGSDQGDWRAFFYEFTEYWRILKPGGLFYGSCPAHTSVWVWGDPGHRRYIGPETFVFLDQEKYAQVGTTPMTDYRHVWKHSFKLFGSQITNDRWFFGLRKE